MANEMAISAGEQGYHMQLESGSHLRTFMQWPAHWSIYGSHGTLEAVRTKVALVASTIARFEPVVLLARPDQITAAQPRMGSGVEFWPIATDDLWARDAGPTFVMDAKGELAVSELNFNGWGNKQQHQDDRRIASRVAEKLGIPVLNNKLVGEGGGIEVDGAGTALAHVSSWVNANRNAASQDEIGKLLLAAVGASKLIWAPGAKGLDITDYHIDALARFVKPGQVLIQLPARKDASDPWNAVAFETCGLLEKATDAEGKRLDVVVVPEPAKVRSQKRQFLASYVNYYVCNGAVIGAEFGDDKSDDQARLVLQQLFPGREVVSLNVDALGEAGGGIHCATQQQPLTKSQRTRK